MKICHERLYEATCLKISKVITKQYSTSFYASSRLLKRDYRYAIFSIYGFVRFADEIVDTFHNYKKEELINDFENDCFKAISSRISMNPVLQSFQSVVNKYNIPHEYIHAFLRSMKMDLNKSLYLTKHETDEYIYGSADVVGLMCLKVFTNNDEKLFEDLKSSAMSLGSAFQKVNFLRDLKMDIHNLNRRYFAEINLDSFDENVKNQLIIEIENDFNNSLKGLRMLPKNPKFAVLTAYFYYLELLKKLKKTKADQILSKRIRISNFKKSLLVLKAAFLVNSI